MSRSRHWRAATVVAVSIVLLAGGASTASACPVPDVPTNRAYADPAMGCPLERLGDQLVRCDVLTGAGVRAPAFVPEQDGLVLAGR